VSSRFSVLMFHRPSVHASRTVRGWRTVWRGRRPFGGPFRQKRGFSAEGVFSTADSPYLCSG
jgi:hypothetical protein